MKVMWNSAHVMDMVNEAKNFGIETTPGKFDWPTLKAARDAYIIRLNGIYERNLGNSGVKIIQGVSAHAVGGKCVRCCYTTGVICCKYTYQYSCLLVKLLAL